jgi:hypothetical protein
MYHQAKRSILLFVLIGLLSAVTALANPVKAEKARQTESFVINLEQGKELAAESKIVAWSTNHSYRLNLKKGETVSFKLHSLNPTSLKIQTPSGNIKQAFDTRTHEGVLSGEGEFVFEISAANYSVYRLEIKRK